MEEVEKERGGRSRGDEKEVEVMGKGKEMDGRLIPVATE